jgi:hypothetical protein
MNILLRDPEPNLDSTNKSKIRQELMESLDLSSIEALRRDLKLREGLLIDFDYGGSLFDSEIMETTGGTTQGEQESDEESDRDWEDEMGPEDVDIGVVMFPQERSGSRTVGFS